MYFLVLLGLVFYGVNAQNYHLNTSYSGNTFFNGFNFFTGDDPTHGTVDYVDQAKATSLGLISITNGKVYVNFFKMSKNQMLYSVCQKTGFRKKKFSKNCSKKIFLLVKV